MSTRTGGDVGGVIPRRLAGQVPEADQDRLDGQSVQPRQPGTTELRGIYVGIVQELVDPVRPSLDPGDVVRANAGEVGGGIVQVVVRPSGGPSSTSASPRGGTCSLHLPRSSRARTRIVRLDMASPDERVLAVDKNVCRQEP